MDNYEKSRDRAQQYFLGFDQEKLIKVWNLKQDEQFLYVSFLGREYALRRTTGEVVQLWSGNQAGFSEVLSIFDLLCHEGTGKQISGRFAPVNSLKGSPKAGGVTTGFHTGAAKLFEKDPEAFRAVCRSLGGREIDMGDMGFQFPLFEDLSVILKFYFSDEDFPASITLLFDDNMLSFVFYETVFYISGFLLDELCRSMKQQLQKL